MSGTRADHSVQELRQLILRLERSGMAEQRPEVRALLERSRVMLRRSRPSPLRVAGKFGALLVLVADGLLLGATPFILWSLSGEPGWVAITLAVLAPLWALARLRRRMHWLGEGWCIARYHVAWAYDWCAEVFSLSAIARLEARSMAREVMWGWRQHRRTLPRRPSLADVANFLEAEYGPQAGREFRRGAEAVGHAREWTLRGGAPRNREAQRMVALRWSALILLFGRLAASGALWPDEAPEQMAELPVARPAEAYAEQPERTARRDELRDLIRRKRQDITNAFGWRLKTSAEIEQRDGYLAQTRADIAALEQDLATLNG